MCISWFYIHNGQKDKYFDRLHWAILCYTFSWVDISIGIYNHVMFIETKCIILYKNNKRMIDYNVLQNNIEV